MDRIMGVLTLKAPVYRQIAEDQSATTTAGIIVVVVAVISGLISGIITPMFNQGAGFLGTALTVILTTIIGWVVGSFVLGLVANLLGGKTNTGEMLRVFGYTQIFSILNIIPLCGWLLAAVLSVIAAVIGIREAAEVSTGKAIAIGIVGIIAVIVVSAVIGAVLAALGLGTGLILMPPTQ